MVRSSPRRGSGLPNRPGPRRFLPRLPAVLLPGLLLTGLLLTGLLALPATAGAETARTGAPQVVASVKPLHSLTAAVMAGVGEPHLLVRGAASPHAFALKPSDARALDRADLIVWVGPGLEAFLEKPVQALGGKARSLPLLEAPGVRTLPGRAGGAWEDGHDHDHDGHDHGHDDHDHDHDHDHDSPPDGHIWLDPRNAQAIVAHVADALTALDPANAATYRANAERTRAALAELDREVAARLAPVRGRPFVVFHDAYHYLEDRYGLAAAGAITVSPELRPSASRLRELRARIRELGAACVFAEPQFEPTLVRTVAEGTGARTGVLDPEGASLPDGPDLYFALLRFNADALAGCLGG